MRKLVTFISLVTLVDLAACKDSSPTLVCPSDLRAEFRPGDTTLAVGQQFTATVSLFGCGGLETIRDTVTWISQDSSVVRVGYTTGLVTAVGPGVAWIHANGAEVGGVGGPTITVHR